MVSCIIVVILFLVPYLSFAVLLAQWLGTINIACFRKPSGWQLPVTNTHPDATTVSILHRAWDSW